MYYQAELLLTFKVGLLRRVIPLDDGVGFVPAQNSNIILAKYHGEVLQAPREIVRFNTIRTWVFFTCPAEMVETTKLHVIGYIINELLRLPQHTEKKKSKPGVQVNLNLSLVRKL